MDRSPTRNRLTHRGRIAVVAVALTLLVTVATASAAGGATVRLTGGDVSVSQTTTVDVVVDTATGDVGAYNLTVSLANPRVATITDVQLRGHPNSGTQAVTVAPDGRSATVLAALVNVTGPSPVTIATVTIRGDTPGSTQLDTTVTALSDKTGHSYATRTESGTLTVDHSSRSSGGNGGSNAGGNGGSNAGGNGGPSDQGSQTTTVTTTQSTGTTLTQTAGTPTGTSSTSATRTSTAPASTTSSQTPGFGLAMALAALLSLAVLARRRVG